MRMCLLDPLEGYGELLELQPEALYVILYDYLFGCILNEINELTTAHNQDVYNSHKLSARVDQFTHIQL